MAYISQTMSHIRAVSAWAESRGGRATLHLIKFELDVESKNRRHRLFPQFIERVGGRLAYVQRPSVDPKCFAGFAGWLPYRPVSWPVMGDKLRFKDMLLRRGVRTPATWATPGQAEADYIVKQSAGSFGKEIAGPFRRGELSPATQVDMLARGVRRGSVFVEQFILGRNVKVWFWGARPFHVQLHEYPRISGDGCSSIRQLAAERLGRAGHDLSTYGEIDFLATALSYQRSRFDDVLALGEQRWLDFRYGRQFLIDMAAPDDNALCELSAAELDQIESVGRLMSATLSQAFTVPVLYAVDAVLDAAGQFWWLEANSNPVCPPTGYPFILETLFELRAPSARPHQMLLANQIIG